MSLATAPMILGVWVWRTATWRPRIVRVSTSGIIALAWSRDGGIVRCASEEGHYRLLSSSTLKTVQVYGNAKGWKLAQFSEDGAVLLVGTSEGAGVEKWDCSPFKKVWQSHDSNVDGRFEHSLHVYALALSAHGKDWAVVRSLESRDEMGTWMSQGKGSRTVQSETTQYANDAPDVHNFPDVVSLSAQGRLLAQSNEGPGVTVWDRVAHKTLWDAHAIWPGIDLKSLYGSGANARALCFSPDDRWLAVSLSGGATILFGAKTGKKYLLADDMKWDELFAFSPDSRFLAGGNDKGDVNIWNVDSRQWVRTLRTGFSPITALAFSPDGAHLAIGTEIGQVQVWRIR